MLKVLLVDDDPSLLAGLRRALLGQPPQWEIRLAKDAREGLDLLAGEPADLVVSDMRMPGMDGADFLECVKESYPHTVRIILSGYSDLNAGIRSVEVAHQFLSKPCSPLTLLRVIEQARGFYEQLDFETRLAVADAASLPSPPSVVAAWEDAIDSREDTHLLASIAASDPALSLKMLQLSNSAYFGDAREVVNVEEAVSWLGFGKLREITRVTRLCRPFASTLDVDCETLRNHAVAVSKLAGSLASQDAGVAAAAGMLHDIGLLAIASEIPDRYVKYREESSDLTIGSWLLAIWGIPPQVIEAVYGHRSAPVAEKINSTSALCIAESVESKRTPGWASSYDLPAGYASSLGVDVHAL